MGKKTLIGLDVGEKRIGVAVADSQIKIAVALDTIQVDGNEITEIAELVLKEAVDTIVIGYPRNQSGEKTAQTTYVESFARGLDYLDVKIDYQDESLTSVVAEERLKAFKKPYTKADIDSQAAAIILQDYLEKSDF